MTWVDRRGVADRRLGTSRLGAVVDEVSVDDSLYGAP